MGAVDVARQGANVARMRRLGAELVVIHEGDATLRAAIDEALRAWVADPGGTYYLLGSAVGPHPYPWLVRELQTVIGREARAQILEQIGRLPHAVLACVGGGSNAIGLFHPFLDDTGVTRIGIEAEGAASLMHGRNGVLHGCFAPVLQDVHGQVLGSHSSAAGLDYSGVGPEHALLRDTGAVRYETVGDGEALEARDACCRLEGILPALESAHALAGAQREAQRRHGCTLLVGLSGRGDKDLA
jgi:tryptophan synthase beta chain